MKQRFYKLEVKDIEKTTAECSVLTLDMPERYKDVFDYTQGQYLTFKAVIANEEIRRSYSLCSSPLDEEWKVAVKKIDGGRFSTFANDVLQAGNTLEVMPPTGRFYREAHKDNQKQYIAFAAGSGITPIISIIKTHLAIEPQSRFKLFYVNRSVSSIILKEELEGLKNKYVERLELFHFLTREERSAPLFNGRIDSEKLESISSLLFNPSDVDDYFICGPNDMVFLIKDYLESKGVDKKKVHFELFNTPGPGVTKKPATVKIDKELLSEVRIKEGGVYQTISIPLASNNILDAALDKNIDLPFACKGGVCCTCKAKLISGRIDQQVIYGLEPEEINAGFILTCLAIPLTDKVEVDFDAYN